MTDLLKEIRKNKKLNKRLKKKHSELLAAIKERADRELDINDSKVTANVKDQDGLDDLESYEETIKDWGNYREELEEKKKTMTTKAYEKGLDSIAKSEGISAKEVRRRINDLPA